MIGRRAFVGVRWVGNYLARSKDAFAAGNFSASAELAAEGARAARADDWAARGLLSLNEAYAWKVAGEEKRAYDAAYRGVEELRGRDVPQLGDALDLYAELAQLRGNFVTALRAIN